MFDIPHVPPVPVAEHKPGFLRHLRQGSVKGIIDRDYSRSVVLRYGQYYEPALQPDVVPLQPPRFTVFTLWKTWGSNEIRLEIIIDIWTAKW